MKNVGDTVKREKDGELFKIVAENGRHQLLMSEKLETLWKTRDVVDAHYPVTDEPFKAEQKWMTIQDFMEQVPWGDVELLKILDVMRVMVMRNECKLFYKWNREALQ